MPALDTNVLVRYVVGDDPGQLAAARRLISRCVKEGLALFVPVTVALKLFREGPAGFADCLHAALANQAGEPPLWTFDKRAARVDGAQALGR